MRTKCTYHVFLLSVDEDERVTAGGAVVDLDYSAGSILLHGQVAEHVKLHLLPESNLHLQKPNVWFFTRFFSVTAPGPPSNACPQSDSFRTTFSRKRLVPFSVQFLGSNWRFRLCK